MIWPAQMTVMAQAALDNAGPGMSPEQHVWLAYIVVTVLLWGYAAMVLAARIRLRRRMEDQENAGPAAHE